MTNIGNSRQKPARRLLAATLLIAQILICLFFVYAGYIKLTSSIATLATMFPWTGQLPPLFVRLTGFFDLAGGLGILLPTLTRITPGLATVATRCLVALQACALIFHLARGEAIAAPLNLALLVILAFILWGRRQTPVEAR